MAQAISLCDRTESWKIKPIQSLHALESSSSSNRGMTISIQDNQPEGNTSHDTVCSRVGVIHKSDFMVYRVSGKIDTRFEFDHERTIPADVGQEKESCIILQGKFLKTSNETLIAICTNHALLFFNASTATLIGQFSESAQDSFGAPVRAIDGFEDNIFAGNDDGYLAHFQYDADKSIVSLNTLRKCVQPGKIYDLSTNGPYVVSGSSEGNVSVWSSDDLSRISSFQTKTAECVTNCLLWSHFVVSSYETGIIRIFDLDKQSLTTLIKAHAKWITSMDLAMKSETLLTISEDSYARIWRLNVNKVNLMTSIQLENQVPVSARFLDNEGLYFAVNCYSRKQILIYQRYKSNTDI